MSLPSVATLVQRVEDVPLRCDDGPARPHTIQCSQLSQLRLRLHNTKKKHEISSWRERKLPRSEYIVCDCVVDGVGK